MRVLDQIDRQEIARLRTAGEYFWLDLVAPAPGEIAELADLLELHEMLVEDLEHFQQRPKLDDYERHVHIVFFGVEDDELAEIHLIVGGDCLVTVRQHACSALVGVRQRIEALDPAREEHAVYRVLDSLTDSFFPFLERIGDEIDGHEDHILEEAGFDLEAIIRLRRRLSALRRVIAPQRDMLAGAGDFMDRVPGLRADEAHDYYRDVYDHLLRIGDAIDGYRDVLTSLHDINLSAQSNRLNVIVYRLTVVGTIFLPITFVTGFFGQNFGWLVRHVDSLGAFLALGVGLEIAAVLTLIGWFRRAGVGGKRGGRATPARADVLESRP